MADAVEARRHPRYDVIGRVKLTDPQGQTILGTMLNIGQGGMLVSIPVELELGPTYQIEIADAQGVFSLRGEALRLHLPPRTATGGEATTFKVGFEFVGTDAAAGKRLSRLLEEAAA
jgi:hypothetical protein